MIVGTSNGGALSNALDCKFMIVGGLSLVLLIRVCGFLRYLLFRISTSVTLTYLGNGVDASLDEEIFKSSSH